MADTVEVTDERATLQEAKGQAAIEIARALAPKHFKNMVDASITTDWDEEREMEFTVFEVTVNSPPKETVASYYNFLLDWADLVDAEGRKLVRITYAFK